LERAIAAVASTQLHFCEPDIYRLRGEALLLQSGGGQAAGAEAEFQRSIAIARQQACLAIELRAVTSLARLWLGQGRRDEARGLLAPVYRSFTEGFDQPDLQRAKALLAELA
jgi:predicted ATPase